MSTLERKKGPVSLLYFQIDSGLEHKHVEASFIILYLDHQISSRVCRPCMLLDKYVKFSFGLQFKLAFIICRYNCKYVEMNISSYMIRTNMCAELKFVNVTICIHEPILRILASYVPKAHHCKRIPTIGFP